MFYVLGMVNEYVVTLVCIGCTIVSRDVWVHYEGTRCIVLEESHDRDVRVRSLTQRDTREYYDGISEIYFPLGVNPEFLIIMTMNSICSSLYICNYGF